jgi:hypothetical protein
MVKNVPVKTHQTPPATSKTLNFMMYELGPCKGKTIYPIRRC